MSAPLTSSATDAICEHGRSQTNEVLRASATVEFPTAASEEDPTDSPIYAKVATMPAIWDQVALIIVPSAGALRAITCADDLIQDESWLSLHAFRPSRLLKHNFESVEMPNSVAESQPGWQQITAKLHFERQGEGTLIIARASTSNEVRKKISIVTETTIHESDRRDRAQSATGNGFEVLSRPRTRKVRLILVEQAPFSPEDLKLLFDMKSSPATLDETRASQGESEAVQRQEQACVRSEAASVPCRRSLWSDLLLFVKPSSVLTALSDPLLSAIDVLVIAAREFNTTFVMMPQFAEYTRRKLRQDILAKAWSTFEALAEGVPEWAALDSSDRRNVWLAIENVLMGMTYAKVFTSMATTSEAISADQRLSAICGVYATHNIGLKELGVSNTSLCSQTSQLEPAIDVFRQLKTSTLGMQSSSAAAQAVLDDPRRHASILEEWANQGQPVLTQDGPMRLPHGPPPPSARTPFTPLDLLTTLQTAIDLTVSAASSNGVPAVGTSSTTSAECSAHSQAGTKTRWSQNHPLSTDDLLPTLAYVILKAAPAELMSRLAYARSYGLSAFTPPEFEWALVTLESVTKWLSQDSLGLLKNGASSEAGTAASMATLATHRSVSGQTAGKDGPSEATGAIVRAVDRARRLSLPTDALLADQLSKDHAAGKEKTYTSQPVSRNASTQSSARAMSGLTLSETSLHGRHSSPVDLVIRPQIVRRASRTALAHAASPGSMSRDVQSEKRPQRDRYLGIPSSTDMTRAESDGGTPQAAKAAAEHAPLRPLMSASRRRSFGSVGVLSAAMQLREAVLNDADQRPLTEAQLATSQALDSHASHSREISSSWLPWAPSWPSLNKPPSIASAPSQADGSGFSDLGTVCSGITSPGSSQLIIEPRHTPNVRRTTSRPLSEMYVGGIPEHDTGQDAETYSNNMTSPPSTHRLVQRITSPVSASTSRRASSVRSVCSDESAGLGAGLAMPRTLSVSPPPGSGARDTSHGRRSRTSSARPQLLPTAIPIKGHDRHASGSSVSRGSLTGAASPPQLAIGQLTPTGELSSPVSTSSTRLAAATDAAVSTRDDERWQARLS
ncbi:unnamed protein product [Jaminaea pallidilutea]